MELSFDDFEFEIEISIGNLLPEKLITFKSDKILYENVKGLTGRWDMSKQGGDEWDKWIPLGKKSLSKYFPFQNYFFFRISRHHNFSGYKILIKKKEEILASPVLESGFEIEKKYVRNRKCFVALFFLEWQQFRVVLKWNGNPVELKV